MNNPSGHNSRPNRPSDKPYGNRSSGGRPSGNGPPGNRPYGPKPYSSDGPRSPRPPGQGYPDRNAPLIRILHQDPDLVIVEKPFGLPLDRRDSITPGPTLIALTRSQLEAAGVRKPALFQVHPMDFDISGLVVLARNSRAMEKLQDEFRSPRIHRILLAVVEGTFTSPGTDDRGPGSQPGQEPAAPAPESMSKLGLESPSLAQDPRRGTVQSFLVDEHQNTIRVVDSESSHPDAKRAVLHYRVLAESQTHTLMSLRLKTSRRHQARAQMKHIGHPVAGDRDYGATTNPIRRLCIHVSNLGFTHPSSNTTVRFYSPAPESFWRAVGQEPPLEPTVKPLGIKKPKLEESWNHVSDWYDDLIHERQSDHYEKTIIPGVLRMLDPKPGQKILDIACGQGAICRELAKTGARITGVDSAPSLIETAKLRSSGEIEFRLTDARTLDAADLPTDFNVVTCIMALMNIDDIDAVIDAAAKRLVPGGTFLAVVLHPSFRAPQQTAWHWRKDEDGKQTQSRAVDAYLTPIAVPIIMNPGEVAAGKTAVTTTTHNRPLQTYAAAISSAGLLINSIEEWTSTRTSQPGPRADAENKARQEIPLFMAIQAQLPTT